MIETTDAIRSIPIYAFVMDIQLIAKERLLLQLHTCSAKCLHMYCMNGMCLSTGAKSRDILYSNLVFFVDEGKQT